MDWLIQDIQENGPATTVEEPEARPVPDFSPAPCKTARRTTDRSDASGGTSTSGGRQEWLRATPRSTSSWATGLKVMDVPTTRRYHRSRHALNRHATYAIAHYLAGGT